MTETFQYTSFCKPGNDYLTNTNEKEEACEDNEEEDNNKKRMINHQLISFHAGRLQNTAIRWNGGGLVCGWRSLEDYSFTCLLIYYGD